MAGKIIVSGMAVLITLLIGTAWAGPQMTPGKWEITTTTDMAGMSPQTATHTQCMTSDDPVPVSDYGTQECQVTDIKIRGNTVS